MEYALFIFSLQWETKQFWVEYHTQVFITSTIFRALDER